MARKPKKATTTAKLGPNGFPVVKSKKLGPNGFPQHEPYNERHAPYSPGK